MACILCGGSPAVRTEQVHVTEETKAKLLAHAEKLKPFGVVVEQQTTFRKVLGASKALGVALLFRDPLDSGVLRRLVLYLFSLYIRKEQILRLRLDEPEQISRILDSGDKKVRKVSKEALGQPPF